MPNPSDWIVPPDPNFRGLGELCAVAYERDAPLKAVSFDTETSGFAFHDDAFCVTFAWSSPQGMEAHYIELDTNEHRELARRILNETPVLVGHNIKFDLIRVLNAGLIHRADLDDKVLHDTEALAHLDNEHRPKGLKALAVSLLKYNDTIKMVYKSGKKKGQEYDIPKEKWEIEQAKKWAKKEYGLKSVKEVGYNLLPRGTVVPYALKDATWTFQLYEQLRPNVEAHTDLWSLYRQEMELTKVLLDMESTGMGVRPDYIQEMVKTYAKKVFETNRRIEAIVGRPVGKTKMEFNPGSNPQVSAFFGERGHARDSYDEPSLHTIDHPLAAELITLRGDEKILSTYLLPIKKEQRGGILHPNIRQHGTRTGRVSSGKETG